MINSYPTLDLHGEYADTARILTEEFLNDNIILQKEYVCIVHGKSGGVLRGVVHEVLKKDKRIKSFKTDFFNVGCTIVKLR